MCGRYSLTSSGDEIRELFDLSEPVTLRPRFNIAPSQPVAGVRLNDRGERELAMFHWGLIPAWAKEKTTGARMINARAETVADKPAYRAAWRARRCLLPASGFYEWQKTGGKLRQPWFISRPQGQTFALAAIWESWQRNPGELPMESCSILTTTANAMMQPIHDRMPVILAATDFALWLGEDPQPLGTIGTLLKPCPNEWLKVRAVDTRVNNPRNDDPGCIAPPRSANPARPALQ